jgi:recombination protein RecT
MGSLAKSTGPTVPALIEGSKGELARALAGSLDVDKFTRVALTLYRSGDDKIQKCDPISFIAAVMQAAQLGLSVDPLLGEFWIIPRRSKAHGGRLIATTVIGYKGLLKRARRCPGVTNIDAGVVREGDMFDAQLGSTPSVMHRPMLSEERRPVIAAYAVAWLKGGPPSIRVLDVAEIDAARERSESPNGAWGTDYSAMARKTALRRLCPMLPLDELTLQQLAREDMQDVDAAPAPAVATSQLRGRQAAALLAAEPEPEPEPEAPTPEAETAPVAAEGTTCNRSHPRPPCDDPACWCGHMERIEDEDYDPSAREAP